MRGRPQRVQGKRLVSWLPSYTTAVVRGLAHIDAALPGFSTRLLHETSIPSQPCINCLISWRFSAESGRNLLTVTAMSFDTPMVIEHNGTGLNAASLRSRP